MIRVIECRELQVQLKVDHHLRCQWEQILHRLTAPAIYCSSTPTITSPVYATMCPIALYHLHTLNCYEIPVGLNFHETRRS